MRVQDVLEEAILRNNIDLVRRALFVLHFAGTVVCLCSSLLLIPDRSTSDLSQFVVVEDVAYETKEEDHHAKFHSSRDFVVVLILPIRACSGAIACKPAANGEAIDYLEDGSKDPDDDMYWRHRRRNEGTDYSTVDVVDSLPHVSRLSDWRDTCTYEESSHDLIFSREILQSKLSGNGVHAV